MIHFDAVGASPGGAAPTISSLSTQYLASLNWANTTRNIQALWLFALYISSLTVFFNHTCDLYGPFNTWPMCFYIDIAFKCLEKFDYFALNMDVHLHPSENAYTKIYHSLSGHLHIRVDRTYDICILSRLAILRRWVVVPYRKVFRCVVCAYWMMFPMSNIPIRCKSLPIWVPSPEA